MTPRMRLAAAVIECSMPISLAGAQAGALSIRIGVLNDVNGLYADLSGSGLGARFFAC
ncbi:MAG: hypothetical protein AB7L90_23310 [Hyphomicrobiaceae bacterium]